MEVMFDIVPKGSTTVCLKLLTTSTSTYNYYFFKITNRDRCFIQVLYCTLFLSTSNISHMSGQVVSDNESFRNIPSAIVSRCNELIWNYRGGVFEEIS